MVNEIPAAAAHHDPDNDRVLDPALGTGKPSAPGNPGADNSGVGPMNTGDMGIVLGTGTTQGTLNPDNVQTGSGAGGMGGTGLIGQPAAEDETIEVAGTSGGNVTK